jgi:hypothetical protein
MRIYDPQNKINNKGEMKNDENKWKRKNNKWYRSKWKI